MKSYKTSIIPIPIITAITSTIIAAITFAVIGKYDRGEGIKN